MIGRRHSLNTSSRIRKVIVHWAEHVMTLGIELYYWLTVDGCGLMSGHGFC